MQHEDDVHTKWARGDAEFHTDYPGVFREEKNAEMVVSMRHTLRDNRSPLIVVLQPGDGTRYKFLLVPEPMCVEMSNESDKPQSSAGYTRDPKVIHPSGGHLFVSDLSFDGGNGTIHERNDLAGIRWRIYEKMSIRNVCTAEALATLIEAVWWADYEADDE